MVAVVDEVDEVGIHGADLGSVSALSADPAATQTPLSRLRVAVSAFASPSDSLCDLAEKRATLRGVLL